YKARPSFVRRPYGLWRCSKGCHQSGQHTYRRRQVKRHLAFAIECRRKSNQDCCRLIHRLICKSLASEKHYPGFSEQCSRDNLRVGQCNCRAGHLAELPDFGIVLNSVLPGFELQVEFEPLDSELPDFELLSCQLVSHLDRN